MGKETAQAPGRMLRHLRAPLPRAVRGRFGRDLAVEPGDPFLRRRADRLRAEGAARQRRAWRSVSPAATTGCRTNRTWAERTARWPRTSSFARPVRVSEPERLEVLVHELGHFLGAAHTSDQNSVMRPKLGDRRSTCQELPHRLRRPQHARSLTSLPKRCGRGIIWHPSMLSPEAKTAVRGAYMVLAKTIPQDPVATSSIESLGPLPESGPPSIASPELIDGARFVVQAMVAGRPRKPAIARHLQGPQGAALADGRRVDVLLRSPRRGRRAASSAARPRRRLSCWGWAWPWTNRTTSATSRRWPRFGRRSSRTTSGRRGCCSWARPRSASATTWWGTSRCRRR